MVYSITIASPQRLFFESMKFITLILCPLCLFAAISRAGELKADINPPDRRGDVLTPHWENWAWHEGASGTATFGGVTVTFRAATNEILTPVLFKAGMDYGAHMAVDGFGVKTPAGGAVEMVISGLAPGKHTIVTYHNEVRDLAPARFDVLIGEKVAVKDFTPGQRVTNDYDVTSTYFEVEAVAGKDVVVKFKPSAANGSFILNGFEIDTADPHSKAIKPVPGNDDEHWPNDSELTWTAPVGAKTHQFYFGTDSNAVAVATVKSPEFKGALTSTHRALPTLDPMQDYFWRVDEVDAAKKVTHGELWRFRVRTLACPTAEGYGRFAIGGRGGRIIEVTNLEDYDP